MHEQQSSLWLSVLEPKPQILSLRSTLAASKETNTSETPSKDLVDYMLVKDEGEHGSGILLGVRQIESQVSHEGKDQAGPS